MTIGPEDGDLPVLLLHSEGDNWLEVRATPAGDQSLLPVLGSIAKFAREALSLGPGEKLGARMFVCHPDDLSILDSARRFMDGQGYAYAFAHDAQGKFAVNARYKEVSTPPTVGIDPLSVAILAAQLQTQMTLQQMQIQLADIQGALDYLKHVDGLDLGSDILADAATIAELWQDLQSDGSISETDWNEVQHLGSGLRAQHTKILGRLAFLRGKLAFTSLDGARAAQQIRPQDVENLFLLEHYVYRAICQQLDLSMAVRQQRGESRAAALERAARLKAKHLRASEAERQLFPAISPHASLEISRLLQTGIFSYWEQTSTIDNAREHVRYITSRVPLTVNGEARVIRLTEAGEGLRALPRSTWDSESDA